jgi:hypothetical protein
LAYQLDFTIPSNRTPWGGDTNTCEINVYALDLSGAAFKWLFVDPADLTAKITLNGAALGSEGVSATWFPDALNPRLGVVTGLTRILPQIAEATLEGLTYAGVADLVLKHWLYITPAGGLQFTHCYGTATIMQGAPD